VYVSKYYEEMWLTDKICHSESDCKDMRLFASLLSIISKMISLSSVKNEYYDCK
jgi:hypothetical protein